MLLESQNSGGSQVQNQPGTQSETLSSVHLSPHCKNTKSKYRSKVAKASSQPAEPQREINANIGNLGRDPAPKEKMKRGPAVELSDAVLVQTKTNKSTLQGVRGIHAVSINNEEIEASFIGFQRTQLQGWHLHCRSPNESS